MRKQRITTAGWLSEDGVLDEQASWMAAFGGARKPRALTYREAMLAVYFMVKRGHDRVHIADRLDISKDRASTMMVTAKKTMINVRR